MNQSQNCDYSIYRYKKLSLNDKNNFRINQGVTSFSLVICLTKNVLNFFFFYYCLNVATGQEFLKCGSRLNKWIAKVFITFLIDNNYVHKYNFYVKIDLQKII